MGHTGDVTVRDSGITGRESDRTSAGGIHRARLGDRGGPRRSGAGTAIRLRERQVPVDPDEERADRVLLTETDDLTEGDRWDTRR